MKVACYTLCRDRLYYTQQCFQSLWENAGYPIDHFVIDNGSMDTTKDWIIEHKDRFRKVVFHNENVGISNASNTALDLIGSDYDLIFKLDNDCQIITKNLVAIMVTIYKHAKKPLLLSPFVTGINRQPKREYNIQIVGYNIGRTGIVGGLCHWLNADEYQQYRYSESLPMAWGQDDHFCDWCYRKRIEMGYVEDLQVAHFETTDGQAMRYPDYFTRKFTEEKF